MGEWTGPTGPGGPPSKLPGHSTAGCTAVGGCGPLFPPAPGENVVSTSHGARLSCTGAYFLWGPQRFQPSRILGLNITQVPRGRVTHSHTLLGGGDRNRWRRGGGETPLSLSQSAPRPQRPAQLAGSLRWGTSREAPFAGVAGCAAPCLCILATAPREPLPGLQRETPALWRSPSKKFAEMVLLCSRCALCQLVTPVTPSQAPFAPLPCTQIGRAHV